MTICLNCGKDIEPTATYCTNCGAPVPAPPAGAEPQRTTALFPDSQQPINQPAPAPKPQVRDKGLYTASLIVLIVGLVLIGIVIILGMGYGYVQQGLQLALLYVLAVPIAVRIWDIREGDAELTLEFALITVGINNIITGVLLLIAWFRARSRARKAKAGIAA